MAYYHYNAVIINNDRFSIKGQTRHSKTGADRWMLQ